MKPRHRTHAGWVDEVRSRPDIPRRTKRLLLEIADGTYVVKARNLYSITHVELAKRLKIDRSNVKRSTWWALDEGWLVVCVPGHNGRQQIYHRSVPWDPPRYWGKRPCEVCGGWRTTRKAKVRVEQSITVDEETGEVAETSEVGVRFSEVGVRFNRLQRTPTRTPYVVSTSAPRAVVVLHLSDPALANVRGRFAPLARVA